MTSKCRFVCVIPSSVEVFLDLYLPTQDVNIQVFSTPLNGTLDRIVIKMTNSHHLWKKGKDNLSLDNLEKLIPMQA